MIGILNRAGLLSGFRLSRHHKVALNYVRYLRCSSTSFIKGLSSDKETWGVGYVKPPSAKTLRLQTADGVPLSYDVIYNSFEYHTKSQYASGAMTSIYLIFSGLLVLTDFENTFPDPVTAGLNIWISILFLYVNIGTYVIAYKSPVRIYHNKSTGDYKAIFNALRPFRVRVLEFRKGMVEKIPPPDPLTLFRFFRYKIKNQKLYMFDFYFRYPGDLYNMFENLETEE